MRCEYATGTEDVASAEMGEEFKQIEMAADRATQLKRWVKNRACHK